MICSIVKYGGFARERKGPIWLREGWRVELFMIERDESLLGITGCWIEALDSGCWKWIERLYHGLFDAIARSRESKEEERIESRIINRLTSCRAHHRLTRSSGLSIVNAEWRKIGTRLYCSIFNMIAWSSESGEEEDRLNLVDNEKWGIWWYLYKWVQILNIMD